MKKSLAILSAVIGAGTGVVATTLAIAARKRRTSRIQRESLSDAINDCNIDISIGDEATFAETEPEEFTDNRGRRITPSAIVMEFTGTGRRVELDCKGMARYYQDDECLEERHIDEWPEGDYVIHYYRTFGIAGQFAWLFFEEAEKDGSRFCKAMFREPGCYKMKYVMAIDEKLEPIILAFESSGRKGFGLGKQEYEREKNATCIGSNVVLRIPDYVKAGDEQGTLKDFVYVGKSKTEYYLCSVENVSVERERLCEGCVRYEFVGWNIVADYGDRYLVRGFGEYLKPKNEHYFTDCFGEHDFERFLAGCRSYEKEKDVYMWIRPVFYKEAPAPEVSSTDAKD